MNEAAQSKAQQDAEMAEVIGRFESIYASAAPRAAATEAKPETASMYALEDFELAFGILDRTDLSGSVERVDAISTAAARGHHSDISLDHETVPKAAARAEAPADELDLEEAFAILRASENGVRSAPAAGSDASGEADEEAYAPVLSHAARVTEPAPAVIAQAKTYRRYAVPAVAAMLLVSVVSGYALLRHHDSSAGAGAPSAAPSTPLRLEYQLQQQPRPNALLARDTR